MRWRGLEPPRPIRATRPSTLRVYQFRHQREGFGSLQEGIESAVPPRQGGTMRPRTLAITAAAAIASTLLLAGSAGAVLAPEGVIVGPGYQYLGTAAPAGAYIAYSQIGRESSPRLYVKAAGGSPVQITKVGLAYDGGFDGTKVIYQLARPREGRSTIRMYDVVSHQFSEPAGVNTGKWQYGPSMSGDWVLFARLGRHRHLYLHNETTTETRKIASIRKPSNRLDP